jgi:exopolyphosphatase/guanosine-5'-triphosphate,3'-diphosphate pyrophosphatase
VLSHEVLRDKLPKLLAMPVAKIAQLPGVSANRAHQVVSGALVADAVMELFELAELDVCPWALREGVILERLDSM